LRQDHIPPHITLDYFKEHVLPNVQIQPAFCGGAIFTALPPFWLLRANGNMAHGLKKSIRENRFSNPLTFRKTTD
jgi:hypothetical protein